MALTFSKTGNFMSITFDGSTDWDSATESDASGSLPDGCFLDTIQFLLSGNSIKVRTGGVDGTIILNAKDTAGDGKAFRLSGGQRVFPAVAAADVQNGDFMTISYRLSAQYNEL